MAEGEKIVAKYDRAYMRNMGLVVLGVAAAVAAVAAVCGVFWWERYSNPMFYVVLGLIALALVWMGAGYLARINNSVVFTIADGKLHAKQLKGGPIPVKELEALAASVSFGRGKKSLQRGSLDEISLSPPIPDMRGDVYLVAQKRQIKFSGVADVFGLMEKIKEVYPDYTFTLWAGQAKREYAYWDPARAKTAQEPEEDGKTSENPEKYGNKKERKR